MPRREEGFTLIEALVAMMIVAMVVISFIGIRTNSLIDATRARNWRLAREIAEEKLSELRAGAHEVPPESGTTISLADKYEEGWSYKIVIGESAVTDLESELASDAAGGDSQALERSEWQRQREEYRKASDQGLSYTEYQDKLAEDDYRRRMEEQAPSEDDFEEVAVAVFFPKLEPDYPEQKDTLVIKARVSTLAISGYTPEQADAVARAKGLTTSSEGGGGAPMAGGTGAR
ncbi:MAG: hypothetical protein RL398_2874 [Planctomycetota bacterium]|jgi:type II secretion system protein I